MKKKDVLKIQMEDIYMPPASEKKAEFLQELPYPQISLAEFLRIQASYIGKFVWLGTVALFFLGASFGRFFISKGFSGGMMAAFSAVLPFAMALLAGEISKSEYFGMQELEMTARYRLEWVMMARLVILSGTTAGLVVGGCILVSQNTAIGIFPCVLYFTVPLLLNAVCTLGICRRVPHLQIRDISFGISVVLAGISVLGIERLAWIYKEAYVIFWIAALCILAMVLVGQMKQYKENLEVYVWN